MAISHSKRKCLVLIKFENKLSACHIISALNAIVILEMLETLIILSYNNYGHRYYVDATFAIANNHNMYVRQT